MGCVSRDFLGPRLLRVQPMHEPLSCFPPGSMKSPYTDPSVWTSRAISSGREVKTPNYIPGT